MQYLLHVPGGAGVEFRASFPGADGHEMNSQRKG